MGCFKLWITYGSIARLVGAPWVPIPTSKFGNWNHLWSNELWYVMVISISSLLWLQVYSNSWYSTHQSPHPCGDWRGSVNLLPCHSYCKLTNTGQSARALLSLTNHSNISIHNQFQLRDHHTLYVFAQNMIELPEVKKMEAEDEFIASSRRSKWHRGPQK